MTSETLSPRIQTDPDENFSQNDMFETIRNRVRRTIVDLAATSTGCHIGGSLSVVDILIAAFTTGDRDQGDEVILSKGHAAAGLYAVMYHLGMLEDDPAQSYGAKGSLLTGHPNHEIPGIRFSTGSLGHGIGYGVGWALARRLKGDYRRSVVVAGDGELQEGLCWEALQIAHAQRLGNFVIVIDCNGGQNDGLVDEISPMNQLASRLQAFGFKAVEVDGHNPEALIGCLISHDTHSATPLAVIAHTIKGKGVIAIENNPSCHYAVLRPAIARKWQEVMA